MLNIMKYIACLC